MGSRRRQPRSDVDTGWYGYRSRPAASSSPGTPETLLPSQQSRTYGHMRIPDHTRLPTEHWKHGHLPLTGPGNGLPTETPLPERSPAPTPRACLVAPRTHGKCLPGSWLQLEVGPLFVFQLPLAGQLCPVCYTDPRMASPRISSRYSTWAAGLGPASAQSIRTQRIPHTPPHCTEGAAGLSLPTCEWVLPGALSKVSGSLTLTQHCPARRVRCTHGQTVSQRGSSLAQRFACTTLQELEKLRASSAASAPRPLGCPNLHKPWSPVLLGAAAPPGSYSCPSRSQELPAPQP